MMDEIVNLMINNGTAIALLIYFIYKDNKFTETITKALTSIEESLEIIKVKMVDKNKKDS